jgi:pyruvate dehydrogenase E1 component alpha subunit
MRSPFALGQLANPNAYHSPLALGTNTTEVLIDHLVKMILIRRAEETVGDMVESGEAKCPCHLGIGQEAMAVGVASALEPTDHCFGAHRSHSHFLALGGSAEELFAEILGKASGCSGGFGGSMHLRSVDKGLLGTVPIVGATIPIATGAGLAAKFDGRGDIAVAFFGDGATEEGVFHESLNLAATMELPVLFVCENNLFSSHLEIRLRQPANSESRYAEAHRINSEVVDGNDVVRVAEATHRLVSRMRAKGGPVFLEGVTYRWRGHVGHREDEDVGVNRQGDLALWKGRDPIGRLVKALLAERDVTVQDIEDIEQGIRRDLRNALQSARSAKYPDEDALLRVVYPSNAREEL